MQNFSTCSSFCFLLAVQTQVSRSGLVEGFVRIGSNAGTLAWYFSPTLIVRIRRGPSSSRKMELHLNNKERVTSLITSFWFCAFGCGSGETWIAWRTLQWLLSTGTSYWFRAKGGALRGRQVWTLNSSRCGCWFSNSGPRRTPCYSFIHCAGSEMHSIWIESTQLNFGNESNTPSCHYRLLVLSTLTAAGKRHMTSGGQSFREKRLGF
jgi:hypothetical protein